MGEYPEDANHHPSVKLTAPDGEVAEIDEMLAPLIIEAWKAGIETASCCHDAGDVNSDSLSHLPHLAAHAQYNAGYAYIDFIDEMSAAQFLTAVANAGPQDAFYVRMVHWAAPGAWRKGISFDDLSSEGDDGTPGPAAFEPYLIKVTFPASDIAEIVDRLRRHNRGDPPVVGEIDWSTVTWEADD